MKLNDLKLSYSLTFNVTIARIDIMGRSKEYSTGDVDKLVRDKVPQLVKDSGLTPVTHIAAGEEYTRRLRAKLQEKVKELLSAPDPASVAEEIGDIQEVLLAYGQLAGLDPKVIENQRQTKHTTNGGFATGVVLERIEKP